MVDLNSLLVFCFLFFFVCLFSRHFALFIYLFFWHDIFFLINFGDCIIFCVWLFAFFFFFFIFFLILNWASFLIRTYEHIYINLFFYPSIFIFKKTNFLLFLLFIYFSTFLPQLYINKGNKIFFLSSHFSILIQFSFHSFVHSPTKWTLKLGEMKSKNDRIA